VTTTTQIQSPPRKDLPACYQMHIVDGIAHFRFERNVLDIGVDLGSKERFLSQLRSAGERDDICAVLFTSHTDCLTNDEYLRFLNRVHRFGDDDHGDAVLADREEHALQQFLLAIDACPKLTVIGLQGHVGGPFVGISLAFDMRLAAPGMVIETRQVLEGVPPGGGLGFYLPLTVGLQRARQILLQGQAFKAHAAQTAGLVNEVLSGVGSNGAFIAACQQRTSELARSMGNVTLTKRLLQPHTRTDLTAYLEHELLIMRQAWMRRE
jgi:enoyl-CoA hydratase/carnithine racemase